jgi:hypothetical protein
MIHYNNFLFFYINLLTAPPTIASRNNSRYIGLTTASTFTSITATTPNNNNSSISNSSSIINVSTSTSRDRDNKLMSVLQARRSALM